MPTICKSEDLLAATTPPLPVYHLSDHHHYHDLGKDDDVNDDDDDDDDGDDEPGKSGRQCEFVVERNSFDSKKMSSSNLMMSGSFIR